MPRVGLVVGGVNGDAGPAAAAVELDAAGNFGPAPLEGAPASVAFAYGLVARVVTGHGGRVAPVPYTDGRQESTTLLVELPGGNPVLVTVSEP